MARVKDDAERLAAGHPPETGELPSWRRPHKRIAHAYRHALSPRQRSAFATWAAFTSTFAAVRGITYSIKYHVGPLHDVKLGNTHLHHYVWGIALVSAAGGVAVYGDDEHRGHPAVGALYGTGLALVVDELALLLELRDVYWQHQGRWSIDAGVGLSGLSGCYLGATEFWHHLFAR
jgi:hypothetical protein